MTIRKFYLKIKGAAVRPPAALRVIMIHIFVTKHLLGTDNGKKVYVKADECVRSKSTVI